MCERRIARAPGLTRRAALSLLGGLAGAALLPGSVAADNASSGFLRGFRQLCFETAKACINRGGWIIPSQAYATETYLRDAYWILGALHDQELAVQTFRAFAGAQRGNGRVPTSLSLNGTVSHGRDDESTALFLLLGLDIVRARGTVDARAIEAAAGYLLDRLEDGRFLTGPGAGSWWLDTLLLPERDVVAYNQGVAAVGLRAAAELGVAVPTPQLLRAETAYRQPGGRGERRLRLSEKTSLVDVSSLVGEHLSLRYFDRPLLSDDQVVRTLSSFACAAHSDGAFVGFRVASEMDGSYLPEESFAPAPDNFPGHYHNGGSWLLYDALALDVAARHGVAGAPRLLEARLQSEVRLNWALHEYLATDSTVGHFGTAPYDWRLNYGWNAYVERLTQ